MNKKYQKIKEFINQSALARRMDITPEYVRMLLSGQRTNKKRLQQLEKIVSDELKEILYFDYSNQI